MEQVLPLRRLQSPAGGCHPTNLTSPLHVHPVVAPHRVSGWTTPPIPTVLRRVRKKASPQYGHQTLTRPVPDLNWNQVPALPVMKLGAGVNSVISTGPS